MISIMTIEGRHTCHPYIAQRVIRMHYNRRIALPLRALPHSDAPTARQLTSSPGLKLPDLASWRCFKQLLVRPRRVVAPRLQPSLHAA